MAGVFTRSSSPTSPSSALELTPRHRSGCSTEPTYIRTEPATTVLSETRATHLSPSALSALNFLLDELLHILVHAALHSPPASTTPTHSPPLGTTVGGPPPARPPSTPAPLGPNEVLTTDRLKSALARILGPTSLAKECILEAELAVRELIRRGSPSLRGDGALKKQGMWGTPVLPSVGEAEGEGEEKVERERQKKEVVRQAEEVFRALRSWVMSISGVGVAFQGTGSASLAAHIAALAPNPTPPADARSDHITFLFALYVERLLTTLSLHLLRLIATVSARSSESETASLSDVEVALSEDDLVWSWAQGMRVRRFIEDEGKKEREAVRRPSLGGTGAAAVGATNGLTPTTSASSNGKSAAGAAALPPHAGTPASPAMSTAAPSTLGRKTSLGGSTLAGPTSTAVGRASLDSSRSGLTYAASSGASVGGRKGSLGGSTGLGISQSASMSALDGDAFDQLISSGRTIKMSSTPDRLRGFERDACKRMPSSSSMPTLASSSASIMSKASSRRFVARDPQRRDLLEEEEGDGASIRTDESPRPQRRKESLKDVLNSPPPWAMAEGAAIGGPGSPNPSIGGGVSRRPSLRPVPDDPLHPMSVAMRVQDSQQSVSTVRSELSGISEATSGEEARVFESPGARMRALKAKDERRDVASERQINNDLMDFFSSSPPPPPPTSSFNPFDEPSPPLSPKKSKGGLRGLVSKVTGGAKKETDDTASLASRRTATRAPSISGASIMTTASSVTALRAAGFSDNAAKAAYQPPPGLGSPKQQQPRERRRTESGSSSTHRSRRQQSISQPAVPPASYLPPPPENPPPGILVHGNGALPPPPVPSVPPEQLVPPQRKSSLKRSPRERELSAASAASAASNGSTATMGGGSAEDSYRSSTSPTASLRRHGRETSATSSGGSRQLPTAETAAPPIVVVPNGVVAAADLSSKSSAETLSAEQHGSTELALLPPAQIDEPVPVVAPPPPVDAEPTTLAPALPVSEPVDEPAPAPRAGSTTPLHTPPTPPQKHPNGRFSSPSPRTSSPPYPSGTTTPRVARFSAPSGAHSAAISRSASGISTGRASPSSSHSHSQSHAHPPLSSPPLSISIDPTNKSLIAVLKELRSAMRFAQTREECVELVEALLRDEARRVEAGAKRESGEKEKAAARKEEQEVEEKEERRGDGEEQARLVEFFLAGGDLEPVETPSSAAAPSAAEEDAAPALEQNGHTLSPSAMTGEEPDQPSIRLGSSSNGSTLPLPPLDPKRASSILSTPEMRIPGGFAASPSPARHSSSSAPSAATEA
ncbi:hypothetical protein JCM8097_006312 [Rhodosporidiobolus ruineniae]